jgi:hypothetical protein
MAGKIARDAGLADQSGYCPIDPESMKSKVDANIFVVGDAAIPGDMPKSAFSANSQAKVAAMIIRAELTKSRAFPARYSNACWSRIAPDDDIKIGANSTRGQDQADHRLRQPKRRSRRYSQAELQRIRRLVQRHRGRRFRLIKFCRIDFATKRRPTGRRFALPGAFPYDWRSTWLQVRALHGQAQSFRCCPRL